MADAFEKHYTALGLAKLWGVKRMTNDSSPGPGKVKTNKSTLLLHLKYDHNSTRSAVRSRGATPSGPCLVDVLHGQRRRASSSDDGQNGLQRGAAVARSARASDLARAHCYN